MTDWKKKYDHIARRVLWFCAVVDDGQTPEQAIESYFEKKRTDHEPAPEGDAREAGEDLAAYDLDAMGAAAKYLESDLASLRAAVEKLAGEWETDALDFGEWSSVGADLRNHAARLRSLLPGGDDANPNGKETP